MDIKEIVMKVAEKHDFGVSFESQKNYTTGEDEFYVDFEGTSPAGEDLIYTEFYENIEDIPRLLRERAEDFDVDEHVAGWLGGNGAPNAETLAEDAKWQIAELNKLADDIENAMK